MSTQNHRPTGPDVLEDAIEALRSAPVSVGPQSDLVASTLGAINNRLAGVTQDRGTRQRRRRVMGYVGYGSLAMVTTVLVCVMLSGFGGGTAAALDKAFEKMQKTEIVRFRVHVNYGGHSERTSEVTVSGNKLRFENVFGADTAWIIDGDAKAALITDLKNRTYQTVDMSEGGVYPIDVLGMNIRDELLALKTQKANRVGPEMLNGEMAEKYTVTGGKAFHTEGDWVIWVGHKSNLPVKVALEAKLRSGATFWVYDSFDWNPKTDTATFSIDPPAEFDETTILRVFPPLPSRKRN